MDDTVQIEASSSPQKKRFSVEAFKFVGDFPFVYLHCSVVVCRVSDSDSRCSKGCIPGLHVNPPYSVMEKLKKEGRAKRALKYYKEPQYMITKGPFSLNDDTANDGPVIALKGPQQDQSKLAENKPEKEEDKGKGESPQSHSEFSRSFQILFGPPRFSKRTRAKVRTVFQSNNGCLTFCCHNNNNNQQK